ncbi:MAG: hypothetical protein Q27BPR15_15785 [Rhodobacter sp. CACIA14H1]|nr:MAG: hypothetical protein Q27BPR15_15785 [Rhodobacter sp. CACIA14H1]
MTKRSQKSAGEIISSFVFAGGGIVLLLGAADPLRDGVDRLLLVVGGLGGIAAAGRFGIAWLFARRR